jgi:hypothetical protein
VGKTWLHSVIEIKRENTKEKKKKENKSLEILHHVPKNNHHCALQLQLCSNRDGGFE